MSGASDYCPASLSTRPDLHLAAAPPIRQPSETGLVSSRVATSGSRSGEMRSSVQCVTAYQHGSFQLEQRPAGSALARGRAGLGSGARIAGLAGRFCGFNLGSSLGSCGAGPSTGPGPPGRRRLHIRFGTDSESPNRESLLRYLARRGQSWPRTFPVGSGGGYGGAEEKPSDRNRQDEVADCSMPDLPGPLRFGAFYPRAL
jgi:hypothetical protein